MAGDIHHRKRKLQEARIISSLNKAPKTVEALAAELGRCPSGVSLYLKRMRAEGRLYVSGHIPSLGAFAGCPAKIWSVGNRPDVEYVPLRRPTPKTSAQERRDTVLRLLAEQPRTVRALAAAMHIVYETAGRYVGQLRKQERRQVYIAKWSHPREISPESTKGGDWTPVYAVGKKPDAPKPKRETSKERHARLSKSRAYRKARNAARRDRYNNVDRVLRQHKKQGPQSWASALFNIPAHKEAA